MGRPARFDVGQIPSVDGEGAPGRAGFAWRKKPGRREYLRACLERGEQGLIARKYEKDGAGILSSIVHSDGLAILDEELSELAPGMTIDFLPFAAALG